jgi:uncharacterized membrane protein YhaH (DUF805 family)
MNWYLKVFNQYFDFSGRARRKEFWIFNLVSLLITWTLQFLDVAFGTFYFSIVASIYSLLVFIPGLAVSIRRLHDIGKSGWYILLVFLPFIGWIWLLILWCMEGESRPNTWGENPKGIGNDRMINQIGKE